MKDLLKKISAKKTKQAFYHLFDFHVHSIASKDVLIEKRDELSEKEKELIKDISITNNTSAKDAENLVLNEDNIVEKYFELISNHSNVIKENYDWSIISITDHNVFKFSSEMSKYSMKKDVLNKNKLIIIPGVELEVSFPFKEDIINSHILLLFAPSTDYDDILVAINSVNSGNWNYGEVLETSSIEKFIHDIRHHKKTPSIAISAHINSTKGIRGEAKKLFTKLEAQIAKLSTNEKENKNEITILRDKLPEKDSYEFDILNLIGKCGFDAIQVANQDDNYYFSKINKINKDLGRSNPVILSDAHKIDNTFNIKDESHPYLKLNEISSSINPDTIFSDIKTSLRLGESRITYSPIKKSTYWIEGIRLKSTGEQTNDFWPYSDTDQECIIPLSRNLNCLIGGRGSGKSAIIESLCFMFDKTDQYNIVSNKNEDWFSRANKVLNNCSIDAPSKYLDSENANKKKVLMHKRSFFKGSTNKKSTIYNLDNDSVDTNKFERLPTVDYYRFNEIEEYTKPEKLRKLFDDICGTEIYEINNEISTIESELDQTKQAIIELAKKHNKITGEESTIKEYIKRLVEYEKANKPEIKIKFDKLDNIEYTEDLINSIEKEYKKIELTTLVTFNNYYVDFLNQLEKEEKTNSEIKFVLDFLDKKNYEHDNIKYKLQDVIDINEDFKNVLEEHLKKLKNKINERIEIAEKELRDDNIDPEEDYRQNCKDNFEESKEEFKKYKETTSSFIALIESRQILYNKLKSLSEKRSKIREHTAASISKSLSEQLDNRVIIIEAKANTQTDRGKLTKWLENYLFVAGTQQVNKRLNNLKKITIDNCIVNFYKEGDFDVKLFVNDKQLVSDGRINEKEAEIIKENNIVIREYKFPELNTLDKDIEKKIPQEIKDGLFEINIKNLTNYLDLYSLTNNDEPVILLNDRPLDTQKKRDIKKLSPGQRSSAILPIILINGEGPLIIDQPEDNLDNKLVREVIVNILTRIKLKRQIIFATHNPNLPVLGDAENVIALQAKGEGQCDFISIGSIDDKETITSITEIMEGGREAFQYRSSLYEEHWQEGAEK